MGPGDRDEDRVSYRWDAGATGRAQGGDAMRICYSESG